MKTNSYLDQYLNTNCIKILSEVEKHPYHSMPPQIIHRLKSGFEFYEFDEQRNQAMEKIIWQNLEFSSSASLENYCEKIKSLSEKNKKDKLITYYCLKNMGGANDLATFILDDKINLIRIYQMLSKSGRLSSKKIIRKEEELHALQKVVRLYCNEINQNKDSSNFKLLEVLGCEIIGLFNILLIQNKREEIGQE